MAVLFRVRRILHYNVRLTLFFMILEPEVLFTCRDRLSDSLVKGHVDEAVDVAPNLSSGRIAQILTELDNDVIIPFLKKIDEKLAADILIKLPREMADDMFRLIDTEISLMRVRWVNIWDKGGISAPSAIIFSYSR
jgi:hypothetical protein